MKMKNIYTGKFALVVLLMILFTITISGCEMGEETTAGTYDVSVLVVEEIEDEKNNSEENNENDNNSENNDDIDEEMEPVEDAEVTLLNAEEFIQTTDEKGKVEFQDVQEGNYNLQVTKPGLVSSASDTGEILVEEDKELLIEMEESPVQLKIDEENSDKKIAGGEEFNLKGTAENRQEEDAEIELSFYINDHKEIMSKNIDLKAGEEKNFDVNYNAPETLDIGDAEIILKTEKDRARLDIEVVKAARFKVDIDEEASDSKIKRGSELKVAANIMNQGEMEASESLILQVKETSIKKEKELTLEPEEEKKIEIINLIKKDLTGEIEVKLKSQSDEDIIFLERTSGRSEVSNENLLEVYYQALEIQDTALLQSLLPPEEKLEFNIELENFYGENLSLDIEETREEFVYNYENSYFEKYDINSIEISEAKTEISDFEASYEAEIVKSVEEIESETEINFSYTLEISLKPVEVDGEPYDIWYISSISKSS